MGSTDLGRARGAEPVSVGHLGDLWPQAVHVAAAVAAVAQQQRLVVVPPLAHLAVLLARGHRC